MYRSFGNNCISFIFASIFFNKFTNIQDNTINNRMTVGSMPHNQYSILIGSFHLSHYETQSHSKRNIIDSARSNSTAMNIHSNEFIPSTSISHFEERMTNLYATKRIRCIKTIDWFVYYLFRSLMQNQIEFHPIQYIQGCLFRSYQCWMYDCNDSTMIIQIVSGIHDYKSTPKATTTIYPK